MGAKIVIFFYELCGLCSFLFIFALRNPKIKTIMAKVYVFMANGFEDVEALIPIDVLRRGGVDVITVSTTEDLIVESAHGVGIREGGSRTFASGDVTIDGDERTCIVGRFQHLFETRIAGGLLAIEKTELGQNDSR